MRFKIINLENFESVFYVDTLLDVFSYMARARYHASTVPNSGPFDNNGTIRFNRFESGYGYYSCDIRKNGNARFITATLIEG